jgi:hypothetical protein
MTALCNDIFFEALDDAFAEHVKVYMRFVTRMPIPELQIYLLLSLKACKSSRFMRQSHVRLA